MKPKKEVYRICGKEVSKTVWDKNLRYTMPAKKAKGLPCSNMREFDAVMDCQPHHTPTGLTEIHGPNGELIVLSNSPLEIVLAVNAYEEMLSALKEKAEGK